MIIELTPLPTLSPLVHSSLKALQAVTVTLTLNKMFKTLSINCKCFSDLQLTLPPHFSCDPLEKSQEVFNLVILLARSKA